MDFEDRFYLSLPVVLRVLLGIAITILIIGYALFQARHLITGPTITLLDDIPGVIATSTMAKQKILYPFHLTADKFSPQMRAYLKRL